MSDISVTVASVAQSTGARTVSGTAGTTITAGQVVYLNQASPARWVLAQADGTALESGSGTQFGIALHASLSGQPLLVQIGGTITIGATVAVGGTYVISATAGGIAPVADLVSTNYLTYLGPAPTAGTINLNAAFATGIVMA